MLALGRPLLAGVSRKSFLGKTLAPLYGGDTAPIARAKPPASPHRSQPSFTARRIVRVHSVRPAVEAARIADAILAQA